VIASTRKTDLMDYERFAALWRRPESKTSLGRITTLSPADANWRELFDSGAA
jgi:hypothetical protein